MEEHTEDSTVFFFDTRRNEKNEMENKEYFIDMKGKNEGGVIRRQCLCSSN